MVTRTGDLRSAVTQRQKTDGKPQHKLSRKVLYGTQPLLLRYEKAYMKREEPHTKRGNLSLPYNASSGKETLK